MVRKCSFNQSALVLDPVAMFVDCCFRIRPLYISTTRLARGATSFIEDKHRREIIHNWAKPVSAKTHTQYSFVYANTFVCICVRMCVYTHTRTYRRAWVSDENYE